MLSKSVALMQSHGTGCALPPLFCAGLPAQGVPREGGQKDGVTVLFYLRAVREARFFLTFAPLGKTPGCIKAEGCGARFRSPTAPSHLECWLCCGSRVMGATRGAFNALVRSFREAEGSGRLPGWPPTLGPAGSLP